jgi:hypothetical protein
MYAWDEQQQKWAILIGDIVMDFVDTEEEAINYWENKSKKFNKVTSG